MHRYIRYFWYCVYLIFFRNTPEDYRPYALFFPAIRRWLVQAFLKECGKKPRVKSGAEMSPNIKFGNYSEFGTRCLIQADVEIGSHVIMGPDVKIYSRNHNFSDTSIPIQQQGKTAKKQLLKTTYGLERLSSL